MSRARFDPSMYPAFIAPRPPPPHAMRDDAVAAYLGVSVREVRHMEQRGELVRDARTALFTLETVRERRKQLRQQDAALYGECAGIMRRTPDERGRH